jgi:hypothetical protein
MRRSKIKVDRRRPGWLAYPARQEEGLDYAME